jgi:hypothetical protein
MYISEANAKLEVKNKTRLARNKFKIYLGEEMALDIQKSIQIIKKFKSL